MKIAPLAAAVILGLTGTAALAQAVNTDWYIAPTVSYTINDNSRVKNHGWGTGLVLGKVLDDRWNVEAGGQYMQFDGKNDEQGSLSGDALYFFNRNPDFAPYATFGLGFVREGYSDTNHNDNLLAKAGLGFTRQLSKNVDFRADARYQTHANKAGPKRLGDWVMSVGLNYHFGGKTQAPAPYVAAPALVPVPEIVGAAPPPPPPPAPRFEKSTLSATELFDFDSAELRMPQAKLDEIANALGSSPEINDVVITGYTDRIGSAKYNQKLSEQRALSVKNYLTSKGIDANRLKAQGKGEANPVVVCTDKKRPALIKCLAPNRRAEVENITIERRVQ
jgi:OOP family OmpA-OmpF porin